MSVPIKATDGTRLLAMLLKEGDYVYINGVKRIMGKKYEGKPFSFKFDILNLDGSLVEAAVDLKDRKKSEPMSFFMSSATKNSPNTNSSYKNLREQLESQEKDEQFVRDLEAKMMDEYAGPAGTPVSWTPEAEGAEGTLVGIKMLISALNGKNGPSNGLFERKLSGLDFDKLKSEAQANLANGDAPILVGTQVNFYDPMQGPQDGIVKSFIILVQANDGRFLEFAQGTAFRVHGAAAGGRKSRSATKKGRKNRRRNSRRRI